MSWCTKCQEDFNYDDVGGYRPPARCGEHCRDCCDGRCEEDYESIGMDDEDMSMEEALELDAEKLRALGGDPGITPAGCRAPSMGESDA